MPDQKDAGMVGRPAMSVWIGFDPRPPEAVCFAVTRASMRENLPRHIPICGIVLEQQQAAGRYWRETRQGVDSDGRPVLIDVPSIRPGYNGRMATAFGVSRFLTPFLGRNGLALFCDCDMMVRKPLGHLFDRAQMRPDVALWCVKHDHRPQGTVKMDGQQQSQYGRKNWSSFMLFNADHPANKRLTLEDVNTRPGIDLHQLYWLEDHEIEDLGTEYNWLAGYSDPAIDPTVVHWTEGVPFMSGYENVPYADEAREVLRRWANP